MPTYLTCVKKSDQLTSWLESNLESLYRTPWQNKQIKNYKNQQQQPPPKKKPKNKPIVFFCLLYMCRIFFLTIEFSYNRI